jgi:hypothetical protein
MARILFKNKFTGEDPLSFSKVCLELNFRGDTFEDYMVYIMKYIWYFRKLKKNR